MSVSDVWRAPGLAGLVCVGVVIALLGAVVPARRAARLSVAEVLRGE